MDLWCPPEEGDPARGTLRTFVLTIAHRRDVDADVDVARTPGVHEVTVQSRIWSGMDKMEPTLEGVM